MEPTGAYIPVVPPDESSRHWEKYYEHVKSGRDVFAGYITIGSEIEAEQALLEHENLHPFDLLDDYTAHISPYIHQYIQSRVVDLEQNEASLQNYSDLVHRAKVFKTFTDQLVLLPQLFQYPIGDNDARAVRRSLIDDAGMYSLFASHIEQGLAILDSTNNRSVTRQIIGLANELTAMALINQPQSANLVALPALPIDDWVNGWDMRVLRYDQKTFVDHGRQVKSNEHAPHGTAYALHQLIGGIAMGNDYFSEMWKDMMPRRRNLVTAQTIVDHVNNENITEEGEHRLLGIAQKLVHAIRHDLPFVTDARANIEVA